MYSRWFSTAVVLLWLSTMGWLVKEKVLPPLLLGDPPSNKTIIEARRGELPVCWQLMLNDREIGWATNSITHLDNGAARINSRVHFDNLPVDEMAPGWLRAIFNVVDRVGRSGDDESMFGNIRTDAESTIDVDASHRLSRIDSSLTFQPSSQTIKMIGVARGDKLEITIKSFDVDLKAQVPLDDKSFMRDALSPSTRLPNLYEGQTWTVSVLTPLKYPNSPHEILQAKVEGLRRITYDGSSTPVWLVTYHGNPGKKLSSDTKPRARLWVRRDGVVLKQEMSILNSTMTFIRKPDK